MTLTSLKKLLQKNSFIYFLLSALCILVYANILPNEFTVVDDLSTFVNNDTIKNFPAALQSMQIQLILYSTFYHLFGITPVPLHILSILLHITNCILFFTIIKLLFDHRTALISALLFALHPINTEAITWISGNPYLFNALIFNICILTYLLYKRTKKRNYLISSVIVFIGGMGLIQTIWLVTIPLVIFIIEQTMIEKKFKPAISKQLLFYIIPLVVFGTLYIGIKGTERLATRSIEHPMNQQTLKPVIEGGPYTIFTMASLYVYPKNLMIYYDGNPVTQTYYIAMYIFTLLYAVTILVLWNKNRTLSGLLLILIVLLAPTFSPIKVSWFLSERYLYYGTGFFALMIALLLLHLQKKIKNTILIYSVIVILAGVYAYRTMLRNADYKNSITLALKTIQLSPHSIRGYDDLGGTYLLSGQYQKAARLFHKTLTILPEANTAVSNLGYIYILYGLPDKPDFIVQPDNDKAKKLYELGIKYGEQERYTNAFFYLYQASLYNPNYLEPKVAMADIYTKMQQYGFAEKQLKKTLTSFPKAYQLYNKLAFTVFQQKKYAEAEKYLREILKYEPNNKEVAENLAIIQRVKQKPSP